MNSTSISIKETRRNLSELIEKVALTGETFLVTKFGKPKALITPVATKMKDNKIKLSVLADTAGLWAKRKDIKDSSSWVSKIRNKESTRYGKILS